MQVISQIKSDYKTSMFRKPRTIKQIFIQWKWPFAIGLLLFAILWRIDIWSGKNQDEPPLVNIVELDLSTVNLDEAIELTNQVNLPMLESTLKNANTLEIPSQQEGGEELKESETLTSVMQKNTKTFTVHPGDNLAIYFQKLKLPPRELHNILKSIKHAQLIKKLLPGQVLSFELDENHQLLQLDVTINKLKTLVIKKNSNQKYVSKLQIKDIERKVAYGRGKISDSLYLAGKQAKLTDKLIMELAQIFEYDIDFVLDIRPGDSFKVLYEEHYVDNEKIGHGPILAAQFTNQDKNFRAFRFIDVNNKAAYYKEDGQSITKAFIRTPVAYTRISSHFNLKRKHPVLHKIRAHKGVDYAAPTGTPVKASGNGKIIHAGRKGGYGNAVILQHGSKYSTLYAHLSRIGKGIKPGRQVKQGQVIGYVGSTGLASGPHLHYEFRVNGVHQNPLTVKLPNAKGIPQNKKDEYQAQTKSYLALMDTHEEMLVASQDNVEIELNR